MGSRSKCCFRAFLVLVVASLASASPLLSPYYYDKVCPEALPTIKRIIEAAVYEEPRMGASLLRLHFHDCFVNGCDASVLLDSSPTIDSEKNAVANLNSARGFEVIDQIKLAVDEVCGHPVVSCADILTVAARDSVVALGGPTWTVQLGRRDSTTASRTQANRDIPSPFMDLPALINNFKNQGLNEKDLVALSGGHTLGFAKCFVFKDRIYNDTKTIDPKFAKARRSTCPRTGGDTNLAPLDPTPANFDIAYFTNLINKRGLLHSDQQLFVGGSTDALVTKYSLNAKAFSADFVKSMVKMGNIKPLTGKQGEIRLNCRKVNDYY
ncbi:Peroxidase 2 precursor, putative [Ricinus communis]|uniref:Peroxidase n=1 Tax=Ricinus communis TaxID=3988 RepID=B9SZA0_RICCO|nr:Peroxidase 2 precursor, putative [Ricinus communis]|eukprot:XP_002531319.1 peroxidase 2 [Ricinus communis]